MDAVQPKNLGRNDPCHCGSGKKYKQCHLAADEAAAPAAEPATKPTAPVAPRHATRQPWKGGNTNTRGFQKVNAQRKVGGGG